jgi:hypothetical protein
MRILVPILACVLMVTASIAEARGGSGGGARGGVAFRSGFVGHVGFPAKRFKHRSSPVFRSAIVPPFRGTIVPPFHSAIVPPLVAIPPRTRSAVLVPVAHRVIVAPGIVDTSRIVVVPTGSAVVANVASAPKVIVVGGTPIDTTTRFVGGAKIIAIGQIGD